jgi:hypothetical protein
MDEQTLLQQSNLDSYWCRRRRTNKGQKMVENALLYLMKTKESPTSVLFLTRHLENNFKYRSSTPARTKRRKKDKI